MLNFKWQNFVNEAFATLSPEVRAELEKQLPESSRRFGRSEDEMRVIVATGIKATVSEGGSAPPFKEAETLITSALEMWRMVESKM